MAISPVEDGTAGSTDWNWALEEQTRIGKLRIWLWRDVLRREQYLEALGEITILTKPNEDELSVQIGNERVDIRVGTPVDVSQPIIELKPNHRIEIGLKVIRKQNGARGDLLAKNDRFGLTKLKNDGIGCICCGRCKQELLDGLDELDTKWFALPSEDWEEFVEYWVCHDDMKIKSGDDGSGGNGLRKPRQKEGFLGDAFLELDLDWIEQVAHYSGDHIGAIGWRSRSDEKVPNRPIKRHFIECSQCHLTVGEVEQSYQDEGIESQQAPSTDYLESSNPCSTRSKRRWIKLYKRAIISTSHQHHHDDDDRGFEVSLVQDEISKLIESNGFYKVLIKNFADSRSIGLWIFCPTVSVCYRLRTNQGPSQKLSRSKLMYVLFNGDGLSEDQKKLETFENGTPLHSIANSKRAHGSERRIGEMDLPADHFELLIRKLRSGSIYSLGLSARNLDRSGLACDHQSLDRLLPPLDEQDEDELFQGIYRVAYL
ncbi:hypothetical protein PCANC_14481 [Puccinia coronata f. sp. avenae]|uniref:HECT domain-containing protein n=1 Tax=Puccinia coronata f. sp. avenae TaxID=200324 RepID=A0A2N5SM04_9BASI|nr:hypothetical protein PCANC_14481 [Puccinia coronata f. sp. avenae]PLW46004.1 hypothetical protein PCASD_03472 [Puccinia coronata f. sp. avenae]